MRVLIADDDQQVARVLAAMVKACQHEVVATVTAGGLETVRSCARFHPDLVLLDVMMPKFNGFTVCNQLMGSHPRLKVVLVSGLVEKTYPSVSNCGAVEYMRKPLRVEQVREMLLRVEQLPALNGAPKN